jgi:cytochrome b561
MPTHNAVRRYDLLSVLLHWTIALFTLALFASGLWMVDLGYYDDWYYLAPWWHKGIGVITAGLILLRWLWMLRRATPAAVNTIPPWQHFLAGLVHMLLNLAVIVLFISGYLIVTAKGDGLSVFDWFTIPALTQDQAGWSELVSSLHLWAGWFIIGLASLHALAALKHHFIDEDATLKRMLFIQSGDDL